MVHKNMAHEIADSVPQDGAAAREIGFVDPGARRQRPDIDHAYDFVADGCG